MKRTEIINALIGKHGYASYFEIGIYDPELNFNHIACAKKVGVDPDPKTKPTLAITSYFFLELTKNKSKI